MNIESFAVDSSRLPLTFVPFCPLSVAHQQKLKQDNYYVDRSELLTRFWTDFPHQYGISVIEVQTSLLAKHP